MRRATSTFTAPDPPVAEPYPEYLNRVLRPRGGGAPRVVDLFAGCGGLALGFESAGFETIGYEKESAACATYRRNLKGSCIEGVLAPDTELLPAKVLIGGPPCQPFSVGGHQMGLKDSRDGFPIFVSAVRRLQPEIFLFENVRGMLYQNRWYLNEIIAAIKELGYVVEVRLLNAVHFGVPQNRERLVVVGHRGRFEWPASAPSKVTAGEALGEKAFEVPAGSRFLTPSMDKYVAKYERASKCIRPRDLHLDRPARTVTCRNLAGATGDMQRLALPDGRRRRLLPREGARLQSFPDWFEFEGTETEQFNQVGNAVAPLFAYHLAGAVRAYLDSPLRLTRPEVDRTNAAVAQAAEPPQLRLL
jgi:DNA (cytosine-5)-methyltransferase 1